MPVNLLLDKRKKVELQMGIGPMTSPLPRECSTTEPLEHYQKYSINIYLGRENGAGDKIRTCDIHLGRVALYQLSYARIENFGKKMVEREGFEPSKDRSDRFTVCCLWPLGNLSSNFSIHKKIDGADYRNRTYDRRFTKPMLYQLS